MQKLFGYFSPMHMKVEWGLYHWSCVRKMQTQGCSTPYIPIMQGFDQCTLHFCLPHSPHAQVTHLTSCCVPGSWHVWSEASSKGQRGCSKADQGCTPWLFHSQLMHDAALWDSPCSLHLFPRGPLVMPIISKEDKGRYIKAQLGRGSVPSGYLAQTYIFPTQFCSSRHGGIHFDFPSFLNSLSSEVSDIGTN